MTTTKEAAAKIRTALKARGWNSRMVSVVGSNYSMGSSIYVTIKSNTIPMQVVRDIASGEEHIDRCEISGEILSGGNCYVHVDYADSVIDAETATILPALEALEELSDGAIETIRGFDVYRCDETWYGTREGFETIRAYDARCAARVLAERTMGLPLPLAPAPVEPASAPVADEPYALTLVAFGG